LSGLLSSAALLATLTQFRLLLTRLLRPAAAVSGQPDNNSVTLRISRAAD
jgi:hypothetical protein